MANTEMSVKDIESTIAFAKNWSWYLICFLVIISIILYLFVLSSPIREYLVIVMVILFIVFVIYKFMK